MSTLTRPLRRKSCGCRLETEYDNRHRPIPPTPIHECCPYCCPEHAGYARVVGRLMIPVARTALP